VSLPSDRLAVIDEVAHYLNTTNSALYSQRHRGENPGALAIRVGRRLVWRPADIEAWLARKQRPVVGPPS
jgi:predicted DNA-binding transcriptional regulator AlpA